MTLGIGSITTEEPSTSTQATTEAIVTESIKAIEMTFSTLESTTVPSTSTTAAEPEEEVTTSSTPSSSALPEEEIETTSAESTTTEESTTLPTTTTTPAAEEVTEAEKSTEVLQTQTVEEKPSVDSFISQEGAFLNNADGKPDVKVKKFRVTTHPEEVQSTTAEVLPSSTTPEPQTSSTTVDNAEPSNELFTDDASTPTSPQTSTESTVTSSTGMTTTNDASVKTPTDDKAVRKDEALKKNPVKKTGKTDYLRAKTFKTTTTQEMTSSMETTATSTEATIEAEEEPTTAQGAAANNDKQNPSETTTAEHEMATTLSSAFISKPHKDLPERWKGLVMRLKKKLEELKAKKGLLPSKTTMDATPSSIDSKEVTTTTVMTTEATKGEATTTSEALELTSATKAAISNAGEDTSPEEQDVEVTTTPGSIKQSSEKETVAVNELTTKYSTVIPMSTTEERESTEITTTQATTSTTETANKKSSSNVDELTTTTVSTAAARNDFSQEASPEKVAIPEAEGAISLDGDREADKGTTPEFTTPIPKILEAEEVNSSESTEANPEMIPELTTLGKASDATEVSTTAAPSSEEGSPFKTEVAEAAAPESKTPGSSELSSVETTTAAGNRIYTTPQDVTITTPNFKELWSTQTATESIATESTDSSTTSTEPTTRDENEESVGGFVVSNVAASSEEVVQNRKTDSQEPLKEAKAATPPASSEEQKTVPFTMQTVTTIVPEVTSNVNLDEKKMLLSRVEEEKLMAESGEFEKRIREERIRYEQERLRKIAEKNEEEKFAEFTSTDLPMVEPPVTKKIRYRLRPSQ
ncbi:hypothetical protein ANCDUO_13708, partial [Ancylostoma duodenale]